MSANSIKEFLKYELYLFFFPLFFVFNQYNKFPRVITLTDTLSMALIYISLMAALRLIWHSLKWKRGQAAMYIISFFIIFFFFGFLHDGLKHFLPNALITRYVFLMPFLFLLFILLYVIIKKSQKDFLRISLYFSILFTALFAIELLTFLFQKKQAAVMMPNNLALCDTCAKPDVYLIVADEYAGQQELQEVFQFDNSDFIKALEAKKFKVAEDPRANYNSTSYSVASLLNMDYLDISGNKENAIEIDQNIQRIQNSLVGRFFSSNGYEFINYSIFNIAGHLPPNGSLFFLSGTKRIHYQTLPGRIEKDLFFHLITRLKWNWLIKKIVNRNISNTEEIISLTKEVSEKTSGRPKFVYTHLMLPHFPYLMDSAGKINDFSSITSEDWSRKTEYLSYLKYSNKRYIELFDHIIKNAKRPFILLFISDHGFRFLDKKPANEPYHFMNISAVYSSTGYCNDQYKGISPVNQFRVILNDCFGQKLPLLKDSTIFIY